MESRVWLVRAGRRGEDEATALEESLAIVGFTMIPDLTGVQSPTEVLERVRAALPGPPVRRAWKQLRRLSM
jgi:predicted Mrr-cat superfamily restriction endonuclease